MNPERERTVVLRVEIPNVRIAVKLLERWAECPGVSVNILRARVTPDQARYELEIQGGAAEVARIVRESVPRRILSAEPALTPA